MRLQVLSLEYSLCLPQALFDDRKCSFFGGRNIDLVPIMHIYGTIQETKQKACLHIHQLYPYFMLSFPYELFLEEGETMKNSKSTDHLLNLNMKKVYDFIHVLGNTIEQTFHRSLYGTPLPNNMQQNFKQDQSVFKNQRQFIHDIVVVTGTPFYGYWFNPQLFLKVYVYNPSHVGKMAAMFGNSSVMGHKFSVYEAHIPFSLQFMMDYNVYGMGDLHVEKLFFRLPFHTAENCESTDKICSQNATNYGTILPENVKRLSKCEIEMDIFSRDILNRQEIINVQLSLEKEKDNQFGKDRKLLQSLNIIWEEERKRRRSINMEISQPPIPFSPFEREPTVKNELENIMYDNLVDIISKVQKNEEEDEIIFASQVPNGLRDDTPTIKQSQEALNNLLSKYPSAFLTYEEIKERGSSYEASHNQNGSSYNIQLTQSDEALESILNWMREKDFELKEDEYNNLGFEDQNDEDEEMEDITENEEQEIINSMKEVIDMDESIHVLEVDDDHLSDAEETYSSDSSDGDMYELIPQYDGYSDKTTRKKDKNTKFTIEDVSIGEFVYLRAPKNCKPYIACVVDKNSQSKTVTVRWFYRPQETKGGRREWNGENEVFLISHCDTNLIDTVIGKCNVLLVDKYFKDLPTNIVVDSFLNEEKLPEEFVEQPKDTYFCRFEYSVKNNSFRKLSNKSMDIFTHEGNKSNLLPSKKRKVSFQEESASTPKKNIENEHDQFFLDNFFPFQEKSILSTHEGSSNIPSQEISFSLFQQALDVRPERFLFAEVSHQPMSVGGEDQNPIEPPQEGNDLFGEAAIIAEESRNQPSSPILGTSSVQLQHEHQSELIPEDEVQVRDSLSPPLLIIPNAQYENTEQDGRDDNIGTPPLSGTSHGENDDQASLYTLNYKHSPPSLDMVLDDLHESAKEYRGMVKSLERRPFFSNHADYLESKRSSIIRFSSIFGKKRVKGEMPISKHLDELDVFAFQKHFTKFELKASTIHSKTILEFAPRPPTLKQVMNELHRDPKISSSDDSESFTNRIPSPEFDEPILDVASSLPPKNLCSLNTTPPNTPSRRRRRAPQSLVSELSVTSQRKKAAFNLDAHEKDDSSNKKELVSKQNINVMSIECHVMTRADFLPNPIYDPVQAIVICSQNCADVTNSTESILLLNRDLEDSDIIQHKLTCIPLNFDRFFEFNTEQDLLNGFIDFICKEDPDILLGYEMQTEGLGYLIERGFTVLGKNICYDLSRSIFYQSENKANNANKDKRQDKILKKAQEYARNKQSGVMIKGRVVINVWRLMNGEMKLDMYTLNNVAFNILGKRIPQYSYQTLSDLSNSCHHRKDSFEYRIILQYYYTKASITLELLNYLDFLNRTGELAKVFGIEFFSVLNRGSQYRVESMMLRLARLYNYVALSPTRKQVMEQAAIECLPLVMEPQSKLYTNPVIVLDFQSLYPSIIIAYNLCYSTCLGKMAFVDQKKSKLGTLDGYEPNSELRKLLKNRNDGKSIEQDILITPNQCLFVKPSVRQGILPRMCTEILNTRVMVKQAMKETSKEDTETQRILNARQLGLKLIANVTYGYTSANFSGRMPLSDLADAIVQLARQTLENAIETVNQHFKGKCRVAYGDTDSLFVECIDCSREEAFKLGKEIVRIVTNSNPKPITLQMERIFHPSFLVSKKRYVGLAFENPSQTKGTLFCKGIEAVRRDNCLMVRSLMEKSLEILFETLDFSLVKSYLSRQFYRIISEKCSLQDFIFWKKVKLGYYKSEKNLPPSARVAIREMQRDPRAEPRFNERVPYVVVFSPLHPSKAKLSDMVIHPKYYIADRMGTSSNTSYCHHQVVIHNTRQKYRLHYNYYITRQLLPSLDRLFSLCFVNCNVWYMNLPKRDVYLMADWRKQLFRKSKNFIERYFKPISVPCVSCGAIIDCKSLSHDEGTKTSEEPMCVKCKEYPLVLLLRLRSVEKNKNMLSEICRHCNHELDMTNGLLPNSKFPSIEEKCISLECPILFSKVHTLSNYASLLFVEKV
ncbi:hypothetical protein C9374_001667 [Naegleria lovaniensis]|uniref:DNA polymerase zeta catalytic subunit n=1 Tax=Naegleria lovaniensis TaxID=51637 RepID=A0AA88GR40_NAELO|nr:uncharacterized protein C9374_001667 [Naegleria lovaniensis]KAG2387335.1 hypothetical protein C9374_001667 [Naegleria lovaniensis]